MSASTTTATNAFRWRNALLIAPFLVLASLALLPSLTHESISPETRAQLESAQASYQRGVNLTASDVTAAHAAFEESVTLYAALTPSMDNAARHYNYANALLRAGNIGQAILEYRRAQLIAPNDARVIANLQQARAKLARSPGVPAATMIERTSAPSNVIAQSTRTTLALLAWSVGLGCLALAHARARRNSAATTTATTTLRQAGLTLAALALLLCLTVALDILRKDFSHAGVLLTSTTLRKGNGEGFEPTLLEPLPAGTEFTQHESRPGWTEIELANGTKGWVHESAAMRVVE